MTPVARLYALPATGTTWNTGRPSRLNPLRTSQWDMRGTTTPPGSTFTLSASNRPRSSGVKRKQEATPDRRWRPNRLQDAARRRCSLSTLDEWTSSPARSAHRVHVSQRNVFDGHLICQHKFRSSSADASATRQLVLFNSTVRKRCKWSTPHPQMKPSFPMASNHQRAISA